MKKKTKILFTVLIIILVLYPIFKDANKQKINKYLTIKYQNNFKVKNNLAKQKYIEYNFDENNNSIVNELVVPGKYNYIYKAINKKDNTVFEVYLNNNDENSYKDSYLLHKNVNRLKKDVFSQLRKDRKDNIKASYKVEPLDQYLMVYNCNLNFEVDNKIPGNTETLKNNIKNLIEDFRIKYSDTNDSSNSNIIIYVNVSYIDGQFIVNSSF